MVAVAFSFVLEFILRSVIDLISFNLLVEPDYKPVAEIVGHTAIVTRGVAYYSLLFGYNLNVRPFVVGIDDNIRFRLREGETEHCSTLSRCNFCCYVIIGKIHLVVVGHSRFALV